MQAHNNFGVALLIRGRLDEAIAEFQAALKTKPDHSGAADNLAIAQSQRAELGKVLARQLELLHARPDDVALLNERRGCWRPTRMRRSAMVAKRWNWPSCAVRLTEVQQPALLGTLAAAYAEAGNFPKAVDGTTP